MSNPINILVKETLEVEGITVADNKINLEVKKVLIKALNHCNLTKAPIDDIFNEIISNIVVGVIKNELNQEENKLHSIKEGDTTLTFTSNRCQSEESIIKDNLKSLNKFKVFKWN
ncbi:MAG: hypothetical protein ACRC30_11055 [Clostridium sp.]